MAAADGPDRSRIWGACCSCPGFVASLPWPASSILSLVVPPRRPHHFLKTTAQDRLVSGGPPPRCSVVVWNLWVPVCSQQQGCSVVSRNDTERSHVPLSRFPLRYHLEKPLHSVIERMLTVTKYPSPLKSLPDPLVATCTSLTLGRYESLLHLSMLVMLRMLRKWSHTVLNLLKLFFFLIQYNESLF